MIYELITTDTGDKILKATDNSGKVWYIPQVEDNSMYQEYLKTL
jgi:hypothetical protein